MVFTHSLLHFVASAAYSV